MRPDVARDLGIYKDKIDPPSKMNWRWGLRQNPGSITYEPANRAAQMLEKKMHDQLEESDASKHLRSVAFECSLLGQGIIKGPFAYDKEYPRWDSRRKL